MTKVFLAAILVCAAALVFVGGLANAAVVTDIDGVKTGLKDACITGGGKCQQEILVKKGEGYLRLSFNRIKKIEFLGNYKTLGIDMRANTHEPIRVIVTMQDGSVIRKAKYVDGWHNSYANIQGMAKYGEFQIPVLAVSVISFPSR